MTNLSDLSQQVFERAVESLNGAIAPELQSRLREMVQDGEIAKATELAAAIAKHLDREAVGAN
jgi:hypothetical protein